MQINLDLIKNIKGFLAHEEGMRLYEIAVQVSSNAPCLEIGSYCGLSSVYIGTACKKNKNILFSIDHHQGSEEQQIGEEYFDPDLFDNKTQQIDTFPFFKQTLKKAGIENSVVPIVARSDIAGKKWDTPLSLVFIDGGHAYETVYTDYKTWHNHIISEGYLAIHDIFKDPSKGGQAPYQIYQMAIDSGLFYEISITKTLGILKRKAF